MDYLKGLKYCPMMGVCGSFDRAIMVGRARSEYARSALSAPLLI